MMIANSKPLQDGSGAIATGGTSQQIFDGKTSRAYLLVQNISDATLYLNFGAAATIDNNSLRLLPGELYENPPNFCPNGTVTIIGATTGKKFVAKQG